MSNRVSVEIEARTQGFQQGMNQASKACEQYNTDTRKISESTENFRKELSKAKKDVQNLALSYAKLDAAAKSSAFGQEMKRQLDAAKQSAAELIDMQGDLQTELKNLASDTQTFDTLTEGVGIFMDATAAAMGVVAQFTGNEEDARKAVVMFTTAQSALSAATKIQNALQMQSATMLGVQKVQLLAASAAANIKAAAEGKGAIATKAATLAQAAFNKIAMANPYVLLATAIIAVVSAIALFVSSSNEAEREEEEMQRKIEETNKRIEEQRKAYVDASAQYNNTASRISHLRTEYMSTNDELKKTAILEEAAEHFKKLGMECNGVTDAQKILVNQGDKVIELMRLQGNAAAIAAMRMEAYKKSMTMLMENDYDASSASILAGYNKDVLEFDKLIDETNTKVNKLKKDLKIGLSTKGGNKTSKQTTKVEVQIDKDSVEAAEQELKKLEEKRMKISVDSPDLPKLLKEIEAKKKEIEAKKIKIGIEVEKTSAQQISEFEKDLKDKLSNLKGDYLKAFLEGDTSKLTEILDLYDQLSNKLKAFQDQKAMADLALDGVEIKPDDVTKALSGDFEKSISGYKKAIATLEQDFENIDWSKLTPEEAEEKTQEYADALTDMKDELEELTDQEEEFGDMAASSSEKAAASIDKIASKAQTLGDVISAASDMFSALGDVADSEEINVMGIVGKAVATIALSFAEALRTATSWVDWLIFGMTGMTTMLSMISSIKSATAGYDSGGIIGGSKYHGDQIMARVESGEMILNKRQQRNLFNLLDNDTMPQAGGANVRVSGVIRGTDLILVQQNTQKVKQKAGTNIHF